MSKRFGDLLAGTIVIRTRSPRAPDSIPPMPTELAGWAGQLELSRLPDERVTAARHLVQRASGLSAYPRDQVATELARQVAARTALPPQQWVPTAEELPAGWR